MRKIILRFISLAAALVSVPAAASTPYSQIEGWEIDHNGEGDPGCTAKHLEGGVMFAFAHNPSVGILGTSSLMVISPTKPLVTDDITAPLSINFEGVNTFEVTGTFMKKGTLVIRGSGFDMLEKLAFTNRISLATQGSTSPFIVMPIANARSALGELAECLTEKKH
jgi:hypothetical protein